MIDDMRKVKEELAGLKGAMDRLWEAEDLLKEIKLTGSHYQIIEKVDKFFDEK
jgi:hypothetical protein